MKSISKFKGSKLYRYCSLTIFLVISITFLSLITSSTLASSSLDDVQQNSLDKTQDDPQKGFLTTIKDAAGYPIRWAVSPLSEDEKEFLREYIGEFLTEYVDGVRPLVIKEFARKGAGRGARALAFKDDLKPASSGCDSGIFFKRNIAEPLRNIAPLVKTERSKGDYRKAGKVIRNSIIGQLMLWPIQIGMGHATAPLFRLASLDSEEYLESNIAAIRKKENAENQLKNAIARKEKQGKLRETYNMVDIYSKYSSWGSPLSEFSDKTADKILALERPEYQWVLPILNAGLSYILYKHAPNALFGASDTSAQSLTRLVKSEAAANAVTTISMLGIVLYDEKYQKYEIFNVGEDGLFDWQTLKDLFAYSLPVVLSQIPQTIADTMNVLSVGLLGNENLSVKRDFDFLSLIIKPFVAAGAQVANKIATDSIAAGETPEDTSWKMRMGLVTNMAMALPYVAVFFKPSLLTSDVAKQGFVRVSAAIGVIGSVERAAKEELEAFKQEDQSWFKTFADTTRLIVPITGFFLMRYNIIESNMKNYIIMQVIGLVPSAFNIIAAWTYGSDTAES